MPGIGVIVNVATVLAGSLVGLFFGKLISERFRSIAFKALGLATIVIGATMAISRLVEATEAGSDYSIIILVGSLVVGSIVGEAIGIEAGLERFGHWLQQAVYKLPFLAPIHADEPGEKGHTLVEGFVVASLLYCVGSMTILGSLQDGMGDPGLLYLKATLDGIASVALASTLGVGVAFSVLPIILVQGGLVLGAHALEPLLTGAVIREMTATGGALIFAIGLDMLEIKRLPVGNMMPALLIAAILGGLIG